jgi:CRP-like cAMP-binding protein
LVDGLVQITFQKDEFVFKEGDEGFEFFIIEKGEVECLKEDESLEGGQKFIRKLKTGDHFGELALINNDSRSLSVRATS